MENAVPVNERRERSRRLQEISRKMKRAFYANFKEEEFEVLFEKSEDGIIEGFTPNYIRVSIPGNVEFENKLMKVSLKSLDFDDVMTAEPIGLQMELSN